MARERDADHERDHELDLDRPVTLCPEARLTGDPRKSGPVPLAIVAALAAIWLDCAHYSRHRDCGGCDSCWANVRLAASCADPDADAGGLVNAIRAVPERPCDADYDGDCPGRGYRWACEAADRIADVGAALVAWTAAAPERLAELDGAVDAILGAMADAAAMGLGEGAWQPDSVAVTQ